MVGGSILLFSKRGWQAQELSPVLGSVGKVLVSLERPMKQDFRVGGALLAASSRRRSPHLKIFVRTLSPILSSTICLVNYV